MRLDHLGFRYNVETGLFLSINYRFEPLLAEDITTEQAIEALKIDFGSLEEIFDKVLVPLGMEKTPTGVVEHDEISSGFKYSDNRIGHPTQSIEYKLRTRGTQIYGISINGWTWQIEGKQEPMFVIYDSVQKLPSLTTSPLVKVTKGKIDLLRKGEQQDPNDLPSRLLTSQ